MTWFPKRQNNGQLGGKKKWYIINILIQKFARETDILNRKQQTDRQQTETTCPEFLARKKIKFN